MAKNSNYCHNFRAIAPQNHYTPKRRSPGIQKPGFCYGHRLSSNDPKNPVSWGGGEDGRGDNATHRWRDRIPSPLKRLYYRTSKLGKIAMPRKIREYKAELIALGFVQRLGKGSHQNWKHPQLQLLITIANLEKLLKKAIQQLETIEREETEE